MTRKLRYITIICILLISVTKNTRAQNWLFANSCGGLLIDETLGVIAGNEVYAYGRYESDPCYFNSIQFHSVRGVNDMFLVKYNNSGIEKWAKSIGGANSSAYDEYINDIINDIEGKYIYITGKYLNSLYMDSLVLIGNPLNTDAFIAKFDSSGNLLWIFSAGGSDIDIGNSLSVDSSGNLYVGIIFNGPGTINGFSLDAGQILAKYDSSGNFIWAKNIGFNIACKIKYSNNSLYIAGNSRYYTDTFWVDTSMFITRGSADLFVGRLDTAGNFIWVNRAGSTLMDICSNIAIDNNSNIYITGDMASPVIFGTDTTDTFSTYLTSYDQFGTLRWIRTFGTNPFSGTNIVRNLACDHLNNVYVCGSFRSAINFNNMQLIPASGQDIYIAKYSSSGTFIDADQLPNAFAEGISIDINNRPVLCGSFGSQINTVGGSVTSHGQDDGFVVMHDILTGIASPERKSNDLLIYANPTTGKCTISVPDELLHSSNALILNLYDSNGKIIQSLPFETNKESIKVDLESEAKGIYVVTLSDGVKVFNGRIVFQ